MAAVQGLSKFNDLDEKLPAPWEWDVRRASDVAQRTALAPIAPLTLTVMPIEDILRLALGLLR